MKDRKIRKAERMKNDPEARGGEIAQELSAVLAARLESNSRSGKKNMK
jgi:hypothetical protein